MRLTIIYTTNLKCIFYEHFYGDHTIFRSIFFLNNATFMAKSVRILKIWWFVNNKQTKLLLDSFRMAVTKQLNLIRIMYFWCSWVQQHWSHFMEFLLNDYHFYTRNNYSWNHHSTDCILLFLNNVSRFL